MLGLFRTISRANQIVFHRGLTSRITKQLKFLPPPERATKALNPGTPKAPPVVELSDETIEELQRLSLVGFEKDEVVKIVQEAIEFAERICQVDTTKVKPLVSLLEEETIYLREDVPDLDVTREEILSNSEITQEHYFVTPLGNRDVKFATAALESAEIR